MSKKPGLDAAYALSGVEDVKSLYADWATTYDASFAKAQGYQLHHIVAEEYVDRGGAGPVLDVGAGTGLVGAALAQRGVDRIQGTDISAEMLAQAREKGCYDQVFVSDVTQPLDIRSGTFPGIVSAGTFTLGHIGPEPLSELIRITRSNGLIVISVNAAHWQETGFAAFFEGASAYLNDLRTQTVPIYAEGTSHAHADDRALIASFRVR